MKWKQIKKKVFFVFVWLNGMEIELINELLPLQ